MAINMNKEAQHIYKTTLHHFYSDNNQDDIWGLL